MDPAARARVTAAQARRIAVRAQGLGGDAGNLLDVVRRLGRLQLDPTARVAPSHLLVLWSRLGAFDVSDLNDLLWRDRALFEWRAFVYPIEDLPAYLSRMRRNAAGDSTWPRRIHEWLETNASFRRYVLRELDRNGQLVSRDLEDRAREPWQSSGWTGNRSVSQMLEFLMARGEVAVAGRRGAQRLWDLAERWYPPVEALADDEADAFLAEREFRSLGVVADKGGGWLVHADADTRPVTRTTLLSPFDRLIHDRVRTLALFGFRYRMEIYVPREQRQYGYFVMPVLHRDRLVGRIDPEFDRERKVLRINAVHWEGDSVDIERPVRDLARFVGAETVEWPAKRRP